MIRLRFLLITASFAAGVFVLDAQAQNGKMYSYVDENGTVVFTDKKPVDRDVSSQAIPPGPPPTGGNPYAQPPEDPQQPTAAQQQREAIAQKSEQSRVARAEAQAQCAAWQAEVDRLEPHRRVFYTDENGETVRMDDVERTNRVAELKAQIAANCG